MIDNNPIFYSDSNFDILFKDSIKTPFGDVIPTKALKHKQKGEHSDTPLSFIIETLKNPKVVLESMNFDQSKNETGRKLYLSSFLLINKKRQSVKKYVLVVCADMKTGKNLIISGYFVKDKKEMIDEEIKSPDVVIFPKNEGPIGTDSP